MQRSLMGVVVLAAGCLCATLFAREATVGSEPEGFNRRWLRDLKSDDFRVREEACVRIAEAGADAIGPLKDAAGDMDRETAARCLGLLERLAKSTDSKTALAAREALGALEASSNPVVADLARSALVKSERLPTPRYTSSRVPFNAFNVPRPMPAAGGFRLTSRTVNGDRTTIIEEPGKTTTITETAGNIRIVVTETVNGAEKTTEHSGKDLEDLRRNSATGAQIYERYHRPGNVDAQKKLDEMRLKLSKARELSRESTDLSSQRIQLRLNGKQDTPEYADLERRIQEVREAQSKVFER